MLTVCEVKDLTKALEYYLYYLIMTQLQAVKAHKYVWDAELTV